LTLSTGITTIALVTPATAPAKNNCVKLIKNEKIRKDQSLTNLYFPSSLDGVWIFFPRLFPKKAKADAGVTPKIYSNPYLKISLINV
jgi:hypothetical protein